MSTTEIQTIKKQRGLSLIELMVTLAVAAVVTVTTVPAMGTFVVDQELRSAQEDIATVLRKAKHTARAQNTNIRVIFTADSSTVQLQLPDDSVVQTIVMGKVNSDADITFQFNSIGTVDAIGTVTLISDRDNARSESINIDTLFGQISLG